jgi:PAS domain S-box-containing protein
MDRKPTYEELELRIKELEAKNLNRKHLENSLIKSEEKCRLLSEGTFEAVVWHHKGKIIEANKQYYEMFGYKPEELTKKDAILLTATPESVKFMREQITLGNLGPYEVVGRKKDGTEFPMEIRVKVMEHKGRITRMAAIRDLTERRQAEEELLKTLDELDNRVKQRTSELIIQKNNLEEANIALKVLLDKRIDDKKETADNLLTNVKELIVPYLEKIKKTKLDEQQKVILSIIESNLNEITSPFARKMSQTYLNLTPVEIKVANLIRHGNNSKEIAELMSLSSRTIYNHRKNIRKKLGLENRKTNLRSHLLSIY